MKVIFAVLGLAIFAGSTVLSSSAAQRPLICRGPGNIVAGTRGSDGLRGTPGRDTICGFAGADTIIGLGGDDVILGGPGYDRIAGGRGNDTIDGGPGEDLAGYRDSPRGVRVDLIRGTAAGGDGRDRLRGIEVLAGSAYEDTLRGGGGANAIYGRGGDDYLQGRAGDDKLDGGDGNDLIGPGPGTDEINGGSGTDVFDFRAVGRGLQIDLSRDINSRVGQELSAQGTDFYIRMDGVLGTGYDDVLRGTGSACVVEGGAWFEGGPGDDVLVGTYCPDYLDGGPGVDRLDGQRTSQTASDRCLNGEVVERC